MVKVPGENAVNSCLISGHFDAFWVLLITELSVAAAGAF